MGGGSVSPRQVLVRLLEQSLGANEPDIVLVRAVLEGRTPHGRRRLVYEARDTYDRRSGLTAMMRTTAFPTSIAVQLPARGEVPPGVHTLERAVPAEEFLRELRRRGVQVRRRWSQT